MRLNETVRRDPMWARLDDQWTPIPKRPGYAVGALVLGVAVLLLPLLYLSLIAAVGYGVYWHLSENVPNFRMVSGRGAIFLIAIYIAPALLGLGLVLFMLKPLIAPPEPRGRPTKLEQFEELNLHSFIVNVCAVIGAPAPKEVHIDCDINASAGFRRGIWSIFSSGDVVLTIGLPLVAAMTKRQFAGILAHEFGHFAQGTGMRLTYMVRSIVNWFVQIAYRHDGWDAALDAVARNTDEFGAWVILAWALKLCVWVTRLVLIAMAIVAQLLCSFMLRQMERDADRYETQLCGADAFVSVCYGVNELGEAMPRAMEESFRLFKKKRQLPDNFPSYVNDFRKRLTPESRDAIRMRIEKSTTGFFSTHPSDRDRIAAARRRNEPGLYLDDSPASELFGDFEAASTKATVSHWQGVVGGPGMAGAELVPTTPLLAGAGFEARASGLTRFFGFELPTWRPVFPGMRAVPEMVDAKSAVQRHRDARARQKEIAKGAAERTASYRAASEKIVVWEQVRTAMDAGFRPNFKSLDLPTTTRAGVSLAIDRLVEDSHRAADVIDSAIDAGLDRLSAAICLLGAKGVDKFIPGADAKRARTNELLKAMAVMGEIFTIARQVRTLNSSATYVITCVTSEKMVDQAKKALRPLADQIRDLLDDARRIGGGTADPLARHAAGDHSAEANLGETLVGATPAYRDFEDIIASGVTFAERFADTHRRMLGELVEIAEGIEQAIAAAAKARAKDDKAQV